MMHRCLICLGANTEAEENFRRAHALLGAAFPDSIEWGVRQWTEPVDFPLNPALFLNQEGTLHTSLTAGEVRTIFKEIERQCGRTPHDKAEGIVRMDIDLLRYDDEQLKIKKWEE